MKSFNTIDRLAGGLVFVIAMLTYGFTIEPTASFWDCPEFITTAFKMEVGHPPGAPFFMLIGKFFSLFASDASQVAKMINLSSAFFSALTILFLFWTITHLGRKMLSNAQGELSIGQMIAVFGSGIIGSLVYTFSDTFWFSAVEAEVYADSSFLTAIVFWLILRWEDRADEPHSDRYLILITYLMGLSIGVHLLNLLTIPSIVLVYYFRKTKEVTFKGSIIALFTSFAILGCILYGLIPGFITLAGYVELFFVNTLHLPFNSGALCYCLLAVGCLIWSIIELYRNHRSVLRIQISSLLALSLLGVPFVMGSWLVGCLIIAGIIVYFARKKEQINIRMMSTVMVSLAVMLLGYSSYALIVIRSVANPPMDQNSPDNVFNLKTYLNREQYGDRPLFYGAYYSAEPELEVVGNYCRVKTEEGDKVWGEKEKTSPDEKDEYIVTQVKQKVVYGSQFKTLFPRLHSNTGDHPKLYESWVDIQGKKVKYDACGKTEKVTVPTFGENLAFFFTYQLGYMYGRYFMWNFSGRQNDIQGHGEICNGNWITGLNFIDEGLVGDQSQLPPYYANNKGHNRYYMLPLLLGILGLVYQAGRGKKGVEGFWVVMTLFFMTGIAIVLYLNQGPAEPRERDYAYAGSFYAFAIWVGMGVAALAEGLKKCRLPETAAAGVALLLALPVPILMGVQNWDDHDRSNRYVVRDFGLNYFNSCAENAVIFTNGDNDTFPLWYTQDTESNPVSLDKRVCNLSYLQTDWYIDQMRRPAYQSAPLPIAWERKTYMEGTRDVVVMRNLIQEPIDLKYALDKFLASDDPTTKQDPVSGGYKEYLPGRKFKVPVNKDNLVKQGAITEAERDLVEDEMIIDLSNKNYLTKSELMILDMIANNNWERPLYYAVTVGSDMYLNLKDYFQLEGLAYRIVPFKKSVPASRRVCTRLMYDNIMHKFKFGGIENPQVYLDENILRMCMAHRQMINKLVESLVLEGDSAKAKEVLDYSLQVIPGSTVPHNYASVDMVEYYYTIGETEKAQALAEEIYTLSTDNLRWFSTLTPKQRNRAMDDIGMNLVALNSLTYLIQDYDKERLSRYYDSFMQYRDLYR